jgi:hypothetical protein
MKNIIAFIALTVFPCLLFSQTKAINKFYNKYKKLENVTDIKLQGWVLKLASNFADEEEAEQMLKKITHLRVLVMEDGNLVSKQEYRQLKNDVKKNSFEELFKIKEGLTEIEFMIREDKESITDVLVLVNGDDEFVLLSLEGKLKFSDLNNLNLEIEGADHFKKIPEDKADIPRA